MNLTTNSHLTSRLRVSGALHPLCRMRTWRLQRLLRFTL